MTKENTKNNNIDSVKPDVDKKKKKPKKLSMKQQVVELTDKLLRTQAEFDNFRKRTQRDLTDARTYSKISTLEEFMPVVDNFKSAMIAVEQNADLDTLVAGMNMISNEIPKVLGTLGVETIDAIGKDFDPKLHEAVVNEFSETVEAGKIMNQWRCGYKLGERLIRPASVVVSNGKEAEAPKEEENTEEIEVESGE